MAREDGATAAALAASRSSGGWKALALFPLAWLGWWSLKGDLLTWLARPLATAWFEDQPPPPAMLSSQFDWYSNFVRMCTIASATCLQLRLWAHSSLPLIAFYVLATFAGRVFGRSPPTAQDAERG